MWTNGDMEMGGPVAAVDEAVPEVAVGDESDDEYQVIAKKPKTAPEPAMSAKESVPAMVQHDATKTRDEASQPSNEMEGVEDTAAADQDPLTDADWLRSRTNRVLDLVEDDEQPSPDVSAPPPAPKPAASQEAFEQPAEATQIEEQPNAQVSAVPTSSEVEKIRDTGRLYLRNLHFDVTEDELRAHFSKYGSLEEVRCPHFLFLHACNDERPR
jgi:multiple RNA-binding domain-containing protein 1